MYSYIQLGGTIISATPWIVFQISGERRAHKFQEFKAQKAELAPRLNPIYIYLMETVEMQLLCEVSQGNFG